jgi:hypothetical protein
MHVPCDVDNKIGYSGVSGSDGNIFFLRLFEVQNQGYPDRIIVKWIYYDCIIKRGVESGGESLLGKLRES